MKTCSYCGRDNQDDAARCQECGTELATAPLKSEAPRAWERVATLDHDVEAGRLASELDSRGIPHVLVSYCDSAFDGLYQMTHGWGHVEAPPEHRDTILSILSDIRQSRGEPESTSPGDRD